MRMENSVSLTELMRGVPYSTQGTLNGIRIHSITSDSKQVREGDLFVAIRGSRHDGHHYLEEAIQRGAVAVVVESSYFHPGVKVLQVSDSKKILSHLAAAWYQFPVKKLKVIGVTGTNGKTTTSYLLEKLLENEGVGIIGTISYRVGRRVIPATQTTPGALELQGLFNEMARARLPFAVLEVSSHALDQSRVADVEFQIGIFTNFSQDHLDYHGSLQAYGQAKLKLFEQLTSSSWAIVNLDDPFSWEVIRHTKAKILRYGFDKGAEVRAERFELIQKKGIPDGMGIQISTPQGALTIRTSLLGRHNVFNLLAALSAGIILEKSLPDIAQGLERLQGVPGRLERIDSSLGFSVFVDYAHTPDGLKQVLATLREITSGRLLVVFGCGGDRDRTKRPQMGKIASELADLVFLTSDNPRSEDPEKIIEEILAGIQSLEKKPMGPVHIQSDRTTAIHEAVFEAKPSDAVLITGKGHEPYQIFKNVTIPFDDRQQARLYIHERETFCSMLNV